MAMEASFSHVMHHPLGVFALLVGISAAIPPLVRRVGLPDLVGLLAAGVLIGPHALQWVETDSETVRLQRDGTLQEVPLTRGEVRRRVARTHRLEG